MDIWLLIALLILVSFNTWYLTRLTDEVRESKTNLMKMVGTTQSRLRMQVRSDPYPKMPRPKAEQHYENQGVPRPERGSVPREVTASNTPVRIGKIARRFAGGPEGYSSDH